MSIQLTLSFYIRISIFFKHSFDPIAERTTSRECKSKIKNSDTGTTKRGTRRGKHCYYYLNNIEYMHA